MAAQLEHIKSEGVKRTVPRPSEVLSKGSRPGLVLVEHELPLGLSRSMHLLGRCKRTLGWFRESLGLS